MSTVHNFGGQASQLLRLTEEESQNPYLALEDFYSCFHLVEFREIMWDWLVAALSTDSGEYSNGYARSNLIFVYEKLGKLLEAAHEINKRRKRKLKRKQRKLENKT